MESRLSRRSFLRAAALTVASGAMAACAPKEIVRTVVVEKEVPIEVVVKETVVIGETVEVEVMVPVEVEVERLVEVEKIVTVTAGEPAWSPPNLEGRELLIWGLQFDPHVETYERLGGVFADHTGVSFTVEPQGWPIQDNIILAMAAGIVPDVCCMVGNQLSELIKQGAILPIDDVIYNTIGVDVGTWFGPVAVQAFQYFGEYWGVPTETSNTSGVTNMNLDHLALVDSKYWDMWPPNVGEVGLRDFVTMWELAAALQQVDEDGNVTRWGMSSEGWEAPQFLGIMRTLGCDWWDPENRTFQFETDAALEAMRHQVTIPVFELGIETHLQQGCTDAQFAEKVSICNGNVTQPGLGLELDMLLDTCVYPSAIPGRDALFVGEGGWGFVLPTQGKNTDVGIEFLKFMCTYEGQKEYSRIYGGLPSSCVAVNNDDELFPADDHVGASLRRAGVASQRTVYYGSGYGPPGEMTKIVSNAVTVVRTGEQSEDQALSECQVALEEMLARYEAEALREV